MTARPWNGRSNDRNDDRARGAAEVAPVVLILKKSQGSVWSEAGKTPLCPTLGWLRDTYGAGSYELRLKLGNRIVCMAQAECAPPAPASTSKPRLLDPTRPREQTLLRSGSGAW